MARGDGVESVRKHIERAGEFARSLGATVVKRLPVSVLESSAILKTAPPPKPLAPLADICAPLIDQLMKSGATDEVEAGEAPRGMSRSGMHDLGSIHVGGTKDFKRRSALLIRAALLEMSKRGKNKTGEKKSLIQKAAETKIF
jgi:hypothetical protein